MKISIRRFGEISWAIENDAGSTVYVDTHSSNPVRRVLAAVCDECDKLRIKLAESQERERILTNGTLHERMGLQGFTARTIDASTDI